MSKWIQDLKAKERKTEAQRLTEAELRLEDSRVIRAKAPGFWKAVTERAAMDCQELKQEFPGRIEYECIFEEAPDVDGFSLSSAKELRRVSATLVLDGLYVGLTVTGRHDPSAPPEMSMREIRIEVDRQNGLRFIAEGIPHRTPDDLAKYLVCLALGIRT